jgi:hypothetical protein
VDFGISHICVSAEINAQVQVDQVLDKEILLFAQIIGCSRKMVIE